MHVLPLVVVVLGSALVALSVIVVMMKLQKPNAVGISPHHRWNRRADAAQALEADAAETRRI